MNNWNEKIWTRPSLLSWFTKIVHLFRWALSRSQKTYFTFLDDLVEICKEYNNIIYKLEGDKWDLERGVKIRILEVQGWIFHGID